MNTVQQFSKIKSHFLVIFGSNMEPKLHVPTVRKNLHSSLKELKKDSDTQGQFLYRGIIHFNSYNIWSCIQNSVLSIKLCHLVSLYPTLGLCLGRASCTVIRLGSLKRWHTVLSMPWCIFSHRQTKGQLDTLIDRIVLARTNSR